MSAKQSTTNTPRAVAYYRMSGDEQVASIPEQEAWARRAAKAHGVDVVASFDDPGIPGSEIEGRPGLMAMIAFVEERWRARAPITAVVLWDMDRLSRANSLRTAAVLDRLAEAGIDKILTNEGWIDLSSDLDLVLQNIKQDLTRAAYSRALGKNVTRSAITRAQAGEWIGGRPPHGYQIDHRKLALGDPAAVAAVRWLFETYAEGHLSLADMARALNERKAPAPRRATKWARAPISRILRNLVYCGDAVYNRRNRGKYYRIVDGEAQPAAKKRGRAQENNAPQDAIIVQDAHAPIIDRDTFARVQARLAERRWRHSTPEAGGGAWVLSGVLRCGDCERVMYGHNGGQRNGAAYMLYECSANSRHGKGTCTGATAVQNVIVAHLARTFRERFGTAEGFARMEAELGEAVEASDHSAAERAANIEVIMARLDGEIVVARRNLLRVPEDLIEGVVVDIRRLQSEREGLAREREELATLRASSDLGVEEVRAALRQMALIEETITEAPPALVRATVATLVESVTVHFDHSRPSNKSKVSEIEVTFVPALANLLQTGCRARQVPITVRVRIAG